MEKVSERGRGRGRSVLEQPDKNNDGSRLETKLKTMNMNDMIWGNGF